MWPEANLSTCADAALELACKRSLVHIFKPSTYQARRADMAEAWLGSPDKRVRKNLLAICNIGVEADHSLD